MEEMSGDMEALAQVSHWLAPVGRYLLTGSYYVSRLVLTASPSSPLVSSKAFLPLGRLHAS
jgi:hypothetical protein